MITLPRVAPETVGISSTAILNFVDALEAAQLEVHSLMLLRHGQVAAQGWWKPYGPELRHTLFSLSKSFTSTAVGFAIQEGLLTLDDRVVDFFPEEAAALPTDDPTQANRNAMRVRDLLTMTTGHDVDSTGGMTEDADGNWARAFLAQPVPHAPGTHFVYDSGSTYMAGRIVQQLTGQTLVQVLTPRLLRPLGIRGAWWEVCPRGYNTGGWGLNVRTEDIARFGQFCLQQGQGQGRQLIDPAWIAAATAFQVQNQHATNPDWAAGYGYQFWQCRHGAYRGDGAFGQFCVVFPALDAVLAMTGGDNNMQCVLDAVWAHLLPAMHDAPLPQDPAVADRLATRLASLQIPLQTGSATSPLAAQVCGQRYVMADNDQNIRWIEADFGEGRTTLTLQVGRSRKQLAVGHGAWAMGKSRHGLRPQDRTQRVAVSGAWSEPDTYRVRLCYYETPFTPTLTLRFDGDAVTFDHRNNASFGEVQRAAVTGRAV